MAPDYQAALAQLLKYDVGRSAYFDVYIPSPMSLKSTNSISYVDSRALSYLCHSAELPGESLATVSQKIYGVVEKFPIMAAYNDITLSFYTYGLGVEMVRKTFMTWIATITGRGEIVGLNTNYNVAYKDDFVCDPVITHYSSDGSVLLTCKLINAFPIAISQIPLAWSADNQAISFNVTFAYTEYQYTMPDNSIDAPTQTFTQTLRDLTGDPASLQTNFTQLVNSAFTPKYQNLDLPTQQLVTRGLTPQPYQQTTLTTNKF